MFDVPQALPKLLGIAEVLAAIGLNLPPIAHVAPDLTPMAAIGPAAVSPVAPR